MRRKTVNTIEDAFEALTKLGIRESIYVEYNGVTYKLRRRFLDARIATLFTVEGAKHTAIDKVSYDDLEVFDQTFKHVTSNAYDILVERHFPEWWGFTNYDIDLAKRTLEKCKSEGLAPKDAAKVVVDHVEAWRRGKNIVVIKKPKL